MIRAEKEIGWSADSCGSGGKGELVIMMLERVAQLMRVRQKKGTDLRNYLKWDQHFPAGATAACSDISYCRFLS